MQFVLARPLSFRENRKLPANRIGKQALRHRWAMAIALATVICLIAGRPAQAQSPVWSCYGPYGGRIRSMAISPEFSVDRTLWVGTELNGLFVSTDGGLSWRSASGIPQGSAISSIVVSPGFAQDRTVFASTTEGALFKSDDGGRSWASWGDDLPIWRINQLAISPTYGSDRTLLAATNRGLYRSQNGGRSWSLIGPQTSAWSVAIAPRIGPDFTAYGGTEAGLYISTDSAQSWGGLVLADQSVIAIALSPDYANDRALMVGTWQGAYFSSDGGASWQGPWLNDQIVSSALFSPSYPGDRTLFLGTESGIYVSVDGGSTWNRAGYARAVRGLLAPFGSTAPSMLYMGTDRDGVLFSTDRGANFTPRNHGIANVPLNAIAISPDYAADRLVFAGGPSGVWKSADDGLSWNMTALDYADVKALRFSPTFAADRALYAATSGGVFISQDGGQSWRAASDGIDVLDVTDITFSSRREAWAATRGGGVYYVAEGQNRWVSRSQGLSNLNITSIEWLSDDGSATYLVAGTWGTGVFTSSNGGLSWAPIAHNPNLLYIRDLASVTDYAGRVLVFAGTLMGTFRSIDRGSSWDFIGPSGRDVYSLALHPNYTTRPHIYVGTGYDGLFISTNGGLTWRSMNDGLNNLNLRGLAITGSVPEPALFAATQGSAWRYGSSLTPPTSTPTPSQTPAPSPTLTLTPTRTHTPTMTHTPTRSPTSPPKVLHLPCILK